MYSLKCPARTRVRAHSTERVKRGSVGSDLDYIRLQGKLGNFWNNTQKSILTEGFSTIFDG